MPPIDPRLRIRAHDEVLPVHDEIAYLRGTRPDLVPRDVDVVYGPLAIECERSAVGNDRVVELRSVRVGQLRQVARPGPILLRHHEEHATLAAVAQESGRSLAERLQRLARIHQMPCPADQLPGAVQLLDALERPSTAHGVSRATVGRANAS